MKSPKVWIKKSNLKDQKDKKDYRKVSGDPISVYQFEKEQREETNPRSNKIKISWIKEVMPPAGRGNEMLRNNSESRQILIFPIFSDRKI